MAPRRPTTLKSQERRMKNGRGQGRGADYKPYLTIRDVPSLGKRSRIKGWKTGREHHLMSTNELHYFYTLEWSECVIDIREQYPLPLDDTLYLCNRWGIAHPADSVSGDPFVMTTDFVLTCLIDDEEIDFARTFKPAGELESVRTLEKFEIERLYWDDQGVNWGIVTERELPRTLIQNMELLHQYRSRDFRLDHLADRDIGDIARVLTHGIAHGNAPLRDVARECDRHFGFTYDEVGTCLAVAYYLIANRWWTIDMHVPIHPGKKLILLGESISKKAAGTTPVQEVVA
jgi:hypothetical protein